MLVGVLPPERTKNLDFQLLNLALRILDCLVSQPAFQHSKKLRCHIYNFKRVSVCFGLHTLLGWGFPEPQRQRWLPAWKHRCGCTVVLQGYRLIIDGTEGTTNLDCTLLGVRQLQRNRWMNEMSRTKQHTHGALQFVKWKVLPWQWPSRPSAPTRHPMASYPWRSLRRTQPPSWALRGTEGPKGPFCSEKLLSAFRVSSR